MVYTFSRFFALLFVALVFISPDAFAQSGSNAIAVVDVKWLSSESEAAKHIRDQVKEHREALQVEFADHEKALRSAEQTLIEEKQTLSSEEFSKKKKAFEEQFLDTRKLVQTKRTALDKAYTKALAVLRKEILEIVASIADEKNYQAVLARSSVVIAQKDIDITEEVMKRLNNKIKKIKLEIENG